MKMCKISSTKVFFVLFLTMLFFFVRFYEENSSGKGEHKRSEQFVQNKIYSRHCANSG